MSLQANTSLLETILFSNKEKGYSVRINAFNGWLERHGYTQKEMAEILNMSEDTLNNKLVNKKIFTKSKILKMLDTFGDKDAFHILYFETFNRRKEIYQELFNRPIRIKKHHKEG